jgi:predicted nucleotide-binding protein
MLIIDGAGKLGYVRDIKGKLYVDLGAKPPAKNESSIDDQASGDVDDEPQCDLDNESESELPTQLERPRPGIDAELARRVFITHGKNKAFLEPIKKLLGFGEMIPVVSVERQSVSKPVPDKVMDDMRGCGAAIIHVDGEQKLIDTEANEHIVVNPNVLMEIGAAMALYGRRFILLVKNGVALPSNLQGLYEVRYNGDTLDGDATIRLLEAINDIKNHELPKREYDGG